MKRGIVFLYQDSAGVSVKGIDASSSTAEIILAFESFMRSIDRLSKHESLTVIAGGERDALLNPR